jgi:hypothetical protein
MNDRNQVRPGVFPIGSLQSRAAARKILEERVPETFILDMSGFPTLFPTPLTEYVDHGDSIVNEVIRMNEGSRAIFLRVIRKDSEEYRKALERGHD